MYPLVTKTSTPIIYSHTTQKRAIGSNLRAGSVFDSHCEVVVVMIRSDFLPVISGGWAISRDTVFFPRLGILGGTDLSIRILLINPNTIQSN